MGFNGFWMGWIKPMYYSLKDLKKVSERYEENFALILACKKKSERHKKLLRIEDRLLRKEIVIRKALSIYAYDPCGGKFCVNGCVLSETIRKARQPRDKECFVIKESKEHRKVKIPAQASKKEPI